MNDNRIVLTIYSSGTVAASDQALLLRRAKDLRFSTLFPGGVFATLSCFIACDPAVSFPFLVGYRLVARNGLVVVWEGVITSLPRIVDTEMGVQINAAGYWGQLLERRGWEKPWADNRLDEANWVYQTGTTGAGDQACTVDRLNRIRFTPKGVAWANGDYSAVRYTAPTGETCKRLTYSYDLQEGAQAWEVSAWRSTDGAAWTQMTNVSGETYGAGTTTVIVASGTGSIDVTLATPSRYLELRFYSRAAQTPVEDGTYYGQYSSLMVYTQTGTITAQSIAKDIRAKVTSLNSDETQIGAPGLTLAPFITAGRETMTAILSRAAGYGDASFNSWAPSLMESDAATTPDGKPVLALAQYPALTAYDYAVRIDDPNVAGRITVVYDLDAVRNWITVKYRDELNNRDVILTPDDDANLKDTTSITTYGQRETPQPLDAGTTSSTIAKNLARRYLAAYKNPRLYVSGPITVKGYIRAPKGTRVPASQIRAGKRIRVENYLDDLASVSGAGLTFVITQTDYDDAAQTCAISTGVPDDLAVFLAQLNFRV